MHLQAPTPNAVETQNPIVLHKQQQTKPNTQKEERSKRTHAHQHDYCCTQPLDSLTMNDESQN
jgi:hypothetical protein